MFTVDKRIALTWLAHLQMQTERFIHELSAETDISVSVFASRVTMNRLRAMLADDDTSEAHHCGVRSARDGSRIGSGPVVD